MRDVQRPLPRGKSAEDSYLGERKTIVILHEKCEFNVEAESHPLADFYED